MERQQDIVLGVIFLVFGLAAAWGATSYSGASGVYPLVLGLLLALTGATVAFKAMRTTVSVERVLIDAPIKLYTAITIGVIYVALVVPLGFYTSSFLLMLGLPFSLGFRRLFFALTVAAIFISIVFFVFSILLERPLPSEALFASFGLGG